MSRVRNANWLWCGLAVVWLAPLSLAQDAPRALEVEVSKTTTITVSGSHGPRIQIALLLDTSNSMDGLIDQAKTQLWKIVNEFIPARQDGRPPKLEVALFEYGNDGLSKQAGYIRLVSRFTTNLDVLSEKLFALRTNGGREYCGQVIRDATRRLAWSTAPGDLKLIFIAGNEPFTQGPVPYHVACESAAGRGVVVNTIHCGDYATGVNTAWRAGALLAGGAYLNIDQNAPVVHIAAPQDDELAQLGIEINLTYIPYGTRGSSSYARQSAQDSNVGKTGAGNSVQRAITKGSSNYDNRMWDLVDAVREQVVKLEDLDAAALPETMRTMTIDERRTYVVKRQQQRSELSVRISELNQQRRKFVAAKMKASSEAGRETLDVAVIKTCREQARAKGFAFE